MGNVWCVKHSFHPDASRLTLLSYPHLNAQYLMRHVAHIRIVPWITLIFIHRPQAKTLLQQRSLRLPCSASGPKTSLQKWYVHHLCLDSSLLHCFISSFGIQVEAVHNMFPDIPRFVTSDFCDTVSIVWHLVHSDNIRYDLLRTGDVQQTSNRILERGFLPPVRSRSQFRWIRTPKLTSTLLHPHRTMVWLIST